MDYTSALTCYLSLLIITTRLSPYQKGKTNLDFTEARVNV